jgi:putative heme iron utilization protein
MFACLLAVSLFAATDDVDQALLDLAKDGTIATLASDYKGTPFATPAPYALDSEGRPVIFLSNLAIHTKNITKNPKCSIMILKEDKDDPFNSARVTFIGKIVKVGKDEREAYKKLFLSKQKSSEPFIDFGDFNFYRLEIESIFYVGGFGDIQWVEPKDYVKGIKTKKV